MVIPLHLERMFNFMNKSQLKTIYPDATFSKLPIHETNSLCLPIENEWFHLPKTNLSDSEIALLKSLFKETETTYDLDGHLWYHYLFQNKPLPFSEKAYRIIQLKIKKESTNSKDWLTHLSKLFNQVEDFFFIDNTTAVLIEEKTGIIPQNEELEGMIRTLESDFLIQANAYVGAFNESSHNFTNYFAEEAAIFSDYYKEQKTVFSFQDIAMDYLTKDKIDISPIMQSLKNSLVLDEEIKEIIQVLWLSQGNITATSKELYIHRNTLQYRLDKFYERFGFSLKDMKDLTICYLLID